MTTPLAITGATGRVGGQVAERLATAGEDLRLVVRDADRAPDLAGAEVRVADYADGDAATAALRGVETLFMVSGAEARDRVGQHRTFIDAAAAAGVTHVVYLSFLGAAPDATFTLARDHHATEEHIRARGLDWTFLRDSLYLDDLVRFIGEDGVVRGPAGEGRVAGVAIADVAAVASAVLRDPASHRGEVLRLTGPGALTLGELAATVSRVTGRDVRYVDETIDEAYASRAHYGVPDWQLDAWVSTYTAIASGELATVTDDVRRVTGHEPLSLEDLLRS